MFLRARLNVSLPGVERDVARAMWEPRIRRVLFQGHTGNIDVAINVCEGKRINEHCVLRNDRAVALMATVPVSEDPARSRAWW